MNHRIESMKPSASMVLMARAKAMQKTDPTVIGLAAHRVEDLKKNRRFCAYGLNGEVEECISADSLYQEVRALRKELEEIKKSRPESREN